jgi:peptidoglycan hydrolase CwlO-like protein
MTIVNKHVPTIKAATMDNGVISGTAGDGEETSEDERDAVGVDVGVGGAAGVAVREGVGVLCIILAVALVSIYFEYSSMVNNRDLQITDKSNQISNLQTSLNGNTSEINSLNDQITSLQNELLSVNANITSLNAQVTSLTNQRSSANSQIASLTAQLATANTHLNSLQNQYNSLLIQDSNLQTWLNGNATALATANTQKREPRANKGKCYLRGGTFRFGFCFLAHFWHSKFLCTLS